jgi:hypothetical protein
MVSGTPAIVIMEVVPRPPLRWFEEEKQLDTPSRSGYETPARSDDPSPIIRSVQGPDLVLEVGASHLIPIRTLPLRKRCRSGCRAPLLRAPKRARPAVRISVQGMPDPRDLFASPVQQELKERTALLSDLYAESEGRSVPQLERGFARLIRMHTRSGHVTLPRTLEDSELSAVQPHLLSLLATTHACRFQARMLRIQGRFGRVIRRYVRSSERVARWYAAASRALIPSTRALSTQSIVGVIVAFCCESSSDQARMIAMFARRARQSFTLLRTSVDRREIRDHQAMIDRLDYFSTRLHNMFDELEQWRDDHANNDLVPHILAGEHPSLFTERSPSRDDIQTWIAYLQTGPRRAADTSVAVLLAARRCIRLVFMLELKEQYTLTSDDDLTPNDGIVVAPVIARVCANQDIRVCWRSAAFLRQECCDIVWQLDYDGWAWSTNLPQMEHVIVPVFGGQGQFDF